MSVSICNLFFCLLSLVFCVSCCTPGTLLYPLCTTASSLCTLHRLLVVLYVSHEPHKSTDECRATTCFMVVFYVLLCPLVYSMRYKRIRVGYV
jgi:hypothetical protein